MTTDVAARGLWQTWFRWTTAGEFAGFLAPALVGAVTTSPQLLVLAGLAEGAVLGTGTSLMASRDAS